MALPLYCPQALACRMQRALVTVASASFPQNSHQPTLLTGYHFLNETASRSRFQESGAPTIQPVAHLTSGSGSLLENGEAFVVEGNTSIHNPYLISPPSKTVPVPIVDESLNLDQNESVIGCVLHSPSASHFAQ